MLDLMGEAISNNLKSFVSSYVSSLVAWAIIVFYHENPGVRDRVSDLARHLGRNEDDIERAVDHLTKEGFLKVEGNGKEAIFVYEPDIDLYEQVSLFVNALDTRDQRLWVLSEVLGK